jgi:hypothetical protein
MKTVEAGKVRKGMLILIEGKQGPRLVTKREKWNSTHCRVHYAPSPKHNMGAEGFEFVRLDEVFEIYSERDDGGGVA